MYLSVVFIHVQSVGFFLKVPLFVFSYLLSTLTYFFWDYDLSKQIRYDKRSVGGQMTFSKHCKLLLADFFKCKFLANCSEEINYFPTPYPSPLPTEFPFHVPSLSAIAGKPRRNFRNIFGNWKKKRS